MLVVKGAFVCSLTARQVHDDFEKLCNLEPSDLVEVHSRWESRNNCPMPRKIFIYRTLKTGQALSEYFHWRHRVRTSTTWFKSGKEVLDRWKSDPSFLGAASRRIQFHSPKNSQEKLAFATVQLNSALLTLTHFRATVSKHLCDTSPKAARVLDFSAGWGDRLTGFMASPRVQHITLIDPRRGSIEACEKQHKFVRSTQTLVLYQQGAEVILPRLPSNSVDLIVTSPPYFDLEHYGESERESQGQIRNKAQSLEEYLHIFLEPVLRNCARVLSSHGRLALNIDDNPRADVILCRPALNILKSISSLEFVGTAGLRKGKGFGRAIRQSTNPKAEPIYIFQKR